MNQYYKVLLPKWVFQSISEHQVKENVKRYLIRYPDYYLCEIKDGFAVCKRH